MPYCRVVAEHELPNDLIRLALHEMFGHAFFVMDDGQALQCTWPGGVEISPLASIQDFMHVDFTFEGIEEAIEHGKKLIGTKYDLENIAGFLFDPAWHDPKKLICSRFVTECAAAAGNPLTDPAVAFYHVPPGWLPATVARGKRILDVWPKDLQL